MRITCPVSGTQQLLDREESIFTRTAHRASLECAPCKPICDARNATRRPVKVAGVASGINEWDVRQRRAEMRRLNLAVTVLRAGASRTSTMPMAAVQLALRVVHPFLGDQAVLIEFWEQANDAVERERPWGGAHPAMRAIVAGQLARGWPVWAEFR